MEMSDRNNENVVKTGEGMWDGFKIRKCERYRLELMSKVLEELEE